MATIKSYTDLQQSKKLAEILPLESADMSWVSNGLGKPFARTIPIKGDPEELCACWSLAALLSVLPNIIGLYYKTLGWFDNDWYCIYIDEDGETIGDDIGANNPVDACYEMIIRLHELKML